MAYLNFPVSGTVDPSPDDLGMKCLHPRCDKNAAQNASGESSSTEASQEVGTKLMTTSSIVLPEVKSAILTGPTAISMGPVILRRPVSTTVKSASDQSAAYSASSLVLYMSNESSTLSHGCLIVVASVLGGLMIIAVISVVLYSRYTRHRDRHDVELPKLDPFLQTDSSRERSSKSDKGWSLPESDQCNISSINLQSSSHAESLPDSSILSSREQTDANPRSIRTFSLLPGQMFQPQFVDSVITCLERDVRRSVGPFLWRPNQEYLPRYSPV